MHNRIIFSLIMLAVYFAANFYICRRGFQALPPIKTLQWTFVGIFSILSITLFASYLLERFLPSSLNTIMETIGSSWMVILLYLFFFVVFFDLLRMINHFIPFFPRMVTENWQLTKGIALLTTVLAIFTICSIGYFKFNHPKVVELNIPLAKHAEVKSLNIVVISDVHLGYTIQKKRLKSYVNKINELKPDMVLITGDLFDRSIRPVIEQKMNEELKEISAPMGVYAVFGNHEYYGNIAHSNDTVINAFLSSTGIHFLRDSSVLVHDLLYIIGRDDKTNPERKSLESLVAGLDQSKPLILLDHQPYQLNTASDNKIDFQFSGHTHNGQVFPITLILKYLYELPYGYKKNENTHYFVSSGLGIWGPPFRIGSQSEILNIHLSFK